MSPGEFSRAVKGRTQAIGAVIRAMPLQDAARGPLTGKAHLLATQVAQTGRAPVAALHAHPDALRTLPGVAGQGGAA
jgi:hypothetical protein